METPNLILSIDEGPKQGVTFDCRPGSFIGIGRIVRGNTLAIKDPGISQKHLIVEFHSDISRWTVTDLGSSNGTTVNGAAIAQKAVFPIGNGDIIKIGDNTLMTVKTSAPSSAPEPRTRRGRGVAAAVRSPIETEVKEEKVTEPSKDGKKGASQDKVCPESANVDGTVKRMPDEGKRRTRASAKSCNAGSAKFHEEVDVNDNKEKSTKNYQVGRVLRKKGIISSGASRNDKALEPVVEEDCRNVAREIEHSARDLKEKNEEMEVGHVKVEGPTKNEGKGMGHLKSCVKPARVLRKVAPLAPVAVQQKRGRDVKALSVTSSARVVVMKDEEGQTSEKIETLVNDGRGGRGRGNKGRGSSRVSWKDDVLESDRVTRASSMTISSSTWVSKVHEGEDEEIKNAKVEPTSKRVKQGTKGKRGSRSTRISKKCDILESVPFGETVEGSLSIALNVAVASSARVPNDIQKKIMVPPLDFNSVYLKGKKKKLMVKKNVNDDAKKLSGSREGRFRIEELEKDKDIMMSEQSNKIEGLHFPGKTELAFSWSSFSEIRGIPNTTSKYREDRLINCHATPFEARVERALIRGISETSSSMET